MTIIVSSSAYSSTSNQHYEKLLSEFVNQNITISQVRDSPLQGVKEVVIKGTQGQEIFYLSEDGQYLIEGKMLDLKNHKDLKKQTENQLRKEVMQQHKKTIGSIDFFPENMSEHVTVFTDIDCGFCRKLHQNVAQYNDLGIGISYLFFPRAGLQSPSYDKAVNVWCADDNKQAMTLAKAGKELEPKMCKNPITNQFKLGIEAGIHKVGTPAVISENGAITGFLPPQAMKQHLEAQKQ